MLKEEFVVDPISLNKSSNSFLLWHSTDIASSSSRNSRHSLLDLRTCHLQQHIPSQGDPEQVAKYGKVAYKLGHVCNTLALIVTFDCQGDP